MFSRYRAAFAYPGALAFSLSGLLARLPISMVTLSIVIIVSTETGSYSLAGTVSAAYVIATAFSAITQARMVDRWGQSRILGPASFLFSLGLALTAWSVLEGWPRVVPHLFAALAGAGTPQIGSAVRARWSHIVTERKILPTALALESVFDELIFMVGPTAVTVLATTIHPAAGLVTAIVASLSGTLLLLAQRTTEPPPPPPPTAGNRPPMPWGVLAPIALSSFMLGALFGGTEVATVAFTDQVGRAYLAGPLLGIWAFGSLVAGLVTGAFHLRHSNAVRYRTAISALAVLMIPVPFLDSVWAIGAMLLLAGMAIAPTMIASIGWIEEAVPAGRITEGITTVTTGLYAGVAPGAAVVGWLVDHKGASAGFGAPVVAGLLGAAIALAAGRRSGARGAD
jgi:MFS family permease